MAAMPVAHTAVPVDHAIFYAGQALDELAAFFERLGFTLTPLGRHSSGSVNRLAILQDQYLELVGFEPGTPPTVRPELQSLPLGLTGIAAADRADYQRRLGRDGLLPARRLERPVDLPGVHGIAAFTNSELRAPAPDVRVFLCRHHTPELVWHPAWQQHANGTAAVTEIAFHTRDPQRLHAALRTAFDLGDTEAGEVYEAHGTVLRIAERAALTLRTGDLAAARRALEAASVAHTVQDGRAVVALPAPYAVDLVFASA
jgi:hypothetical protein